MSWVKTPNGDGVWYGYEYKTNMNNAFVIVDNIVDFYGWSYSIKELMEYLHDTSDEERWKVVLEAGMEIPEDPDWWFININEIELPPIYNDAPGHSDRKAAIFAAKNKRKQCGSDT